MVNQFTSAPQGGSSHPLLSTAATAPAHASARTSGRLRPGPPLPFRSVHVPQRPPPSGAARSALWNLRSFKNAPHPIKPSQGAPPPCRPAVGDIIPPATLSVAFPPPEPVSWVGATSWDGGRGAPGWPLRLPHPAPPHTHSEVTILNLHNSDRSPNVPSPKANVHPAPPAASPQPETSPPSISPSPARSHVPTHCLGNLGRCVLQRHKSPPSNLASFRDADAPAGEL